MTKTDLTAAHALAANIQRRLSELEQLAELLKINGEACAALKSERARRDFQRRAVV